MNDENRITLQDLKAMRTWCVRREKVPYNVHTGLSAASNKPDTWCTFDEAVTAHGYDGVGLMLSRGVCAIDIDGINHTDVNPLAREVLNMFSGTYAETSPSGVGYHVYFVCDMGLIPQENGKLAPQYYMKNPHNGLEIYFVGLTNRYMTFTGEVVSTESDITDQTDNALAFLDKYMRRSAGQEARSDTHDLSGDFSGDGDKIASHIDKARKAKNGEKFSALYDHGDTSAYNGDDSAADQALCAMLAFWLEGDESAIDTAFRQSALYRDKWERADYRSATITKGIERNGGRFYKTLKPYGERKTALDEFTEYDVHSKNNGKCISFTELHGDLTELGLAKQFARIYNEELCFTSERGWLTYDGTKWVEDSNAPAQRYQIFADAMQNAIRKEIPLDADIAKAAYKFGFGMRAAKLQRNVIELAKSRLSRSFSDFDVDPWLLNCKNGTVNLKTGEIAPHKAADLISKICGCEYHTDAYSDRWNDFLMDVFCGDEDLIEYMRYAAGMAIVGHVYEEGIHICVGGGRNGKSTLFNALASVTGNYSVSMSADTFMAAAQRGAELRGVEALQGTRLAIAGENEEGARLNSATLKRLSSTDTIVARRLYHDTMTFRPTHSLFLFTNFPPKISSNDVGTWRRIRVLPFNAKFDGTTAIADYADLLYRECGDAILHWMVTGAIDFNRNGNKLPPLPAAGEGATQDYRDAENWCRQFIDECCIVADDATCKGSELYTAYIGYCNQTDSHKRRNTDFANALRQEGFESRHTMNGAMWTGICIKY